MFATLLDSVLDKVEWLVWSFGIPMPGGETIPFLVIGLIGSGIFFTLRLGFIQIRHFGHGVAVTSGRYDDPADPGDVSHFQALTTALSATVGIGNIAGVAIALHWGGPGALFWMWVTAFFGMALKYAEVTLALHYRDVGLGGPGKSTKTSVGSVAGGPMYYIEKGLGPAWKPVAMVVAGSLAFTAMFGPNAVQSNTVADNFAAELGMPTWITGLVTSTLLALVILGGIKRIGRVTSILAPSMAMLYVSGCVVILARNWTEIVPGLALIVQEAFEPTAGVAGAGAGTLLTTLMWGVRRGLFSNEAGQGSAPIAHAAAQTDEPVSEGVVALLEPFIDTLVICTMTGLVLIATGSWNARVPTELDLASGDLSWVRLAEDGTFAPTEAPPRVEVREGRMKGEIVLAWHEAPVEELFLDADHHARWNGFLDPAAARAVVFSRDSAAKDREVRLLHGLAAENGAPMTQLAFQRGLGPWGGWVVLISVFFFAVSTSISWSYYGDRCIHYLLGDKALRPYKLVYVLFHFSGAVLPLATVWRIGDVAQTFATIPNLIAVVALSGVVVALTRSYFERRPWRDNVKPKSKPENDR